MVTIKDAIANIHSYAEAFAPAKGSESCKITRMEAYQAIKYLRNTPVDELTTHDIAPLKVDLEKINKADMPKKTWVDTALVVAHFFTLGISYLLVATYRSFISPSLEDLKEESSSLSLRLLLSGAGTTAGQLHKALTKFSEEAPKIT